MGLFDSLRFAFGSILFHRLRSVLTAVGITIGIASVVLLTSIGEGVRVYLVQQFSQFGTNIIAINPGKMETWGIPAAIGGTTRKLTLDDARALGSVRGVKAFVPVTIGKTRVERGVRGRYVYVYGVTSQYPVVVDWGVRSGRFLPEEEMERGAPVCVIGPTVRSELFPNENPLGKKIRIGGHRFQVIGIMESKGRMLGFDIDDSAFIPISRAMKMFNRPELDEIDLIAPRSSEVDIVAERVKKFMIKRHDGEEDFTVTTQGAMLDVFGNVMNVITGAVAGIAGISLFVGAIGILTVLWISVHERTQEIGLSVALGARRSQILFIFLTEAVMIAVAGGAVGIAAGLGGAALIHTLVPGLPVETSPNMVAMALGVSILVGILAGIAPAGRAARMDPVDALRTE
ncbi:MAG: ABC transporter permease [Planctomycetota bacterium]|nr:ABC transporter permease [Planctomycetota bacterium]